jgi:hypothetical protein
MSGAMRVAWLAALALIAACACGRAGGGGTGGGSGTGGGGGSAADCEAIRERVGQLYTAVPRPAPKPETTDTFVADNAQMVMAECAREPGRVVPCAKRVGTALELESRCLAPLDDEGTEGDVFRTP